MPVPGKNRNVVFALAISLAVLVGCGQDDRNEEPETNVDGRSALLLADPEPIGTANPLRDAYFGETHMHTSFSLDA